MKIMNVLKVPPYSPDYVGAFIRTHLVTVRIRPYFRLYLQYIDFDNTLFPSNNCKPLYLSMTQFAEELIEAEGPI